MNTNAPMIGICIARTETSSTINDILFDIIEHLEYKFISEFNLNDLKTIDEEMFQNPEGVSYVNLVKQFFIWATKVSDTVTMDMSFYSERDEHCYEFIHNVYNYDTNFLPWRDDDCYTLSVANMNMIIELTKAYTDFCQSTMNGTLFTHFYTLGGIGLHYR